MDHFKNAKSRGKRMIKKHTLGRAMSEFNGKASSPVHLKKAQEKREDVLGGEDSGKKPRQKQGTPPRKTEK